MNGIRACWENGLKDFLYRENPEVIAFQEVKSQRASLPPEIAEPEGYSTLWHCGGRPGYSGVAAFIREDAEQPLWWVKGLGIPEVDAEGRVLTLEFSDFFLVTAYFPNSGAGGRRVDFKASFCRQMETFCRHLRDRGKGVILTGDFNIAPAGIDLHSVEENRGHPGTLTAETQWMNGLLERGWVDVFRRDRPEQEGHFSWWSFFDDDRAHNRGWRIDHVVASADFAPRVKAELLPEVMGSDHCPVVARVEGRDGSGAVG